MGDKLSEEDVRDIVHNPVYPGLGPFPKIISDEKWIEANAVAIEREGKEEYLRKLLEVLGETFGGTVESSEEPV
ncbi:hypothetical protein AKJ41_02120 [candidate division MSBL1 archaeon SCGC-AAA259O05]|uniref:Uncharacterized protein n=1 Tax=candidate division MSBL1 archaeon SCGC-AAA259O05 TaxID=1698271 RepID=A0A133V4A0_9EURY|nr:hypothetical protein AKJ41_02120 [candidate division MSBL1 archaeon SCGC-AAA259O05]